MDFENILFKSKQLTSQITGVYELSLSGFSGSDLTEMVGVALNLCSSLNSEIQGIIATAENAQPKSKVTMDERHQTSFAARLRLALAHSGMTQADLAKQIGVSQGTISSYITGKVKEAGIVRARLMAQALRVSALWLIYGEGEMQPAKFLTHNDKV
ncbi:helix-turn-helix domain-containing protein [Providencia stuartii]|uniref:helix-turn-helix domain-containing protein n=1 Tax=Providencia stuartii TaxID=588 RepID=UPI0023B1EBAD|nr:helix-turn-helix transcriptional regulator [Providencia thailandensis]MDE8747131.1 helix-turn-helix transcriptional regulator [Providencia thailandensis]MDE8765650.1 helix-turn-helix transcriptional regulator [Providencia thailandensis]MDE8777886.1 helix-turn-helix transcriptional regulator [Providencia thailandensis]MDE8782378.1 helix-turn-helix transcriptional regulator [Providencia thailandensis]MDE8786136.1 helix-turn-helix transcriptional regulator [Providencia thailandensis]